MAAVTPSTTYRESCGSGTLIIANFAATTDDGDTWASGIEGIVSVMACQADTAGTATSTGAGASFSGKTVTFHIGEADSKVTLWVFAKA
jgi:hypothetical protein